MINPISKNWKILYPKNEKIQYPKNEKWNGVKTDDWLFPPRRENAEMGLLSAERQNSRRKLHWAEKSLSIWPWNGITKPNWKGFTRSPWKCSWWNLKRLWAVMRLSRAPQSDFWKDRNIESPFITENRSAGFVGAENGSTVFPSLSVMLRQNPTNFAEAERRWKNKKFSPPAGRSLLVDLLYISFISFFYLCVGLNHNFYRVKHNLYRVEP